MKKIITGLIVSFFIPAVLSAQSFVPNTMILNPNHPGRAEIFFSFDSEGVHIPVEVQGAASRAVLMIYTSGKAEEIGKSRHGYRGWRWINKVDTSIYISPSVDLVPGDNPTSIFWNFNDKDGNRIQDPDEFPYEFNYYLFAYEYDTPKVPVMNRDLAGTLGNVYHWSFFEMRKEGGDRRDAPMITMRSSRWVVGGDPSDPANLKTTSQNAPQMGGIDMHDESYFYQTFNHDGTKSKHVRRYQWVENGTSIQDMEWGIGDGVSKGFTPVWEGIWGSGTREHSGTATDMDYIYEAGNARGNHVIHFNVLNYHGDIVKIFDMSHLYVEDLDPPPGFAIFTAGGPNQIRVFNEFSSTKLNLNSHAWCWRVVVDPIRGLENADDLIVWVNGNGDYFTDNYTPETQPDPIAQWYCNTVNSAPYTYQMTSDANGVGVIHTYGIGTPTFGLFGPDGTGAGYHALYGESGDRLKYATHFVKYDTQWDGLYTDGNSTHPPQDTNPDWPVNRIDGVWYTPANSFAGKLIPLPDSTVVATPVFSRVQGTYSSSFYLTISCITEGATIHYTTNGDDPTQSDPVYTGPIHITSTTTVKARGYKSGLEPSRVRTGVYTVSFTVLSFSPAPGTFTTPISVTISTSTAGETIRYTTDGSDPTENDPVYTAPVLIDSTTTLKARAYKSGLDPSVIKTGVYTIACELPTFSPAPGTFTTPASVTISTSTAGATIRYTTDGSDPNEIDQVYTAPVLIDSTTTLKARAYKSGLDPSAVSTGVYSILCATPLFSPAPGGFADSVSVTISCQTEGAVIYYTINGNDPTENDMVYTDPVHITSSTTFKARAYRSGLSPSLVATGAYYARPVLESFSINDGKIRTTNRTVTLNNTAINSPTHYMASEHPNFSWAVWRTYSAAPQFTINPSLGRRAVYLKVRNAAGESNVMMDWIELIHPHVPSIFTNVVETGLSQAVLVQSASFWGRQLMVGDWVAVFDGDRCVGAERFTGSYPLMIPVWLEFTEETAYPGAVPGNNMSFKVWDLRNAILLSDVNPTYIKGEGVFGETMTEVSLLNGNPETSQRIILAPGKANLISFNLESQNMSIESLLSGVQSLDMVGDDEDKVYKPFEINTIGTVHPGKGYWLQHSASKPDTILITGVPVRPDTISYSFTTSRLYLVGSPYQAAVGTLTAFGSILNKLALVSDDDGKFFIPEHGINTLKALHPGRGYQLIVKTDCDFTWPAEEAFVSVSEKDPTAAIAPGPHFSYTRTGSPFAVLIASSEFGLEHGDEIGIFDGGLCVGAGVYEGYFPVAVPAWKGCPEHGLPGYVPGNDILVRVWKTGETREYQVEAEGGIFENWPMSILSITTPGYQSSKTVATALDQNYPNPFNPSTTINYSLEKKGKVLIRVYDVNGRLVKTLIDSEMPSGNHKVIWDGKDENGRVVAAGIYFARMNSDSFNKTMRMLFLK